MNNARLIWRTCTQVWLRNKGRKILNVFKQNVSYNTLVYIIMINFVTDKQLLLLCLRCSYKTGTFIHKALEKSDFFPFNPNRTEQIRNQNGTKRAGPAGRRKAGQGRQARIEQNRTNTNKKEQNNTKQHTQKQNKTNRIIFRNYNCTIYTFYYQIKQLFKLIILCLVTLKKK